MDKRQVLSWCLFDFANSSYSAVIAAVIFPVYYAGVIVGNSSGEGDLWWGRAISLSMLIIALSSPFLGGIADYAGLRKRLLAFYTVICVVALSALTLLSPGAVIAGFTLIVFANIGMEGGLVFYNSFLPRIAPAEYQGRVSSWGFSVGYAGSIVSLLIALPLVKSGHYGLTGSRLPPSSRSFPFPRSCFCRETPGPTSPHSRPESRASDRPGKRSRNSGNAGKPRRFLIAYLLYEDGVNTVIVFSSILAATTCTSGPGELIGLYITVQFTALVGAFVLANPLTPGGPKKSSCSPSSSGHWSP